MFDHRNFARIDRAETERNKQKQKKEYDARRDQKNAAHFVCNGAPLTCERMLSPPNTNEPTNNKTNRTPRITPIVIFRFSP